MPSIELPSPYALIRGLVKAKPQHTASQIASLATMEKMYPEATFDQLRELALQAGARAE